jgi:hypothetical protein
MKLPSVSRGPCFLCVLVVLLPLGKAVAATPIAESGSSPVTGAALKSAVREALTAARKQPQPDAAAVRKLTELYRTLQVDLSLTHTQRESLRLAVRARLKAWAGRLEHTARLEAADQPVSRDQPVSKRLPAPRNPRENVVPPQVLAQQAPPIAGPQPATTQSPTDHSQELLDAIQDTIAPDTWDVRGGLGVIRFWPPGQALIVRQTGEVHEQLGRLIGDLRQ